MESLGIFFSFSSFGFKGFFLGFKGIILFILIDIEKSKTKQIHYFSYTGSDLEMDD
jgi:hypothetical protein